MLSVAEKLTNCILKNGITVRTLKEWQRIKKLDFDADFNTIVNGIRERFLSLAQKRIDFDDNWLDFAALPEGKYSEEIRTELFHMAEAGYNRGYVGGFFDREQLFCLADDCGSDDNEGT